MVEHGKATMIASLILVDYMFFEARRLLCGAPPLLLQEEGLQRVGASALVEDGVGTSVLHDDFERGEVAGALLSAALEEGRRRQDRRRFMLEATPQMPRGRKAAGTEEREQPHEHVRGRAVDVWVEVARIAFLLTLMFPQRSVECRGHLLVDFNELSPIVQLPG